MSALGSQVYDEEGEWKKKIHIRRLVSFSMPGLPCERGHRKDEGGMTQLLQGREGKAIGHTQKKERAPKREKL